MHKKLQNAQTLQMQVFLGWEERYYLHMNEKKSKNRSRLERNSCKRQKTKQRGGSIESFPFFFFFFPLPPSWILARYYSRRLFILNLDTILTWWSQEGVMRIKQEETIPMQLHCRIKRWLKTWLYFQILPKKY